MKRSSGFSLVELLVVMAIIAALMAVMIPSVTQARARSMSKAMQSYGGTVATTFTGFQTSRPGLNTLTLLQTTGWGAAPALPGGAAVTLVAGQPARDCAAGYTLGGTDIAPTVGPGGMVGSGSAWPAAPSDGRCVITTDTGSNEYAVRVITWSDRLPGSVYVNGQKVN